MSFPGFGGAAGGGRDSLEGDPEGSGGCANLLTRLSTDGLLDSWYSAELADLMLELRWGVGGGFFPPGLEVLLVFLTGDPVLLGVGEAAEVAGGGGGGNTKLLSGGGGGKSGEGAEAGCHFGFAFTAGGDCGATLSGRGFKGGGSEAGGVGGGGN